MLKKFSKAALTGGAVLSLGFGIALAGASSAQAIDFVDCGNRTDFLKYNSSTDGSKCFANSGTRNVWIPSVNYFTSGNDAGVTYYAGSGGVTSDGGKQDFGKNSSYSSYEKTVKSIWIY